MAGLRVIHIGLGQIGHGVIRALGMRGKRATVVAAVDANPEIAGKKLREVVSGESVPNLIVEGSLGAALKRLKGKVDVATVTTGSTTVAVSPTMMALADAGVHAVSSCEEMAYPMLRSPAVTKKLDAYAAKRGVAILATGVNPGFAMDIFALACTAPVSMVSAVKVVRSLDATKRRYQLQKKVAATMELGAVKKLIKEGKIGHVGLSESIAMIAAGLGWKLTKIEEKFEPLVAEKEIASEWFKVLPGQVKGLSMRGWGRMGKRTPIELDLTMAFGVETFDEVRVSGSTNLTVRTAGGFPGEASTVGMMVNCVDCVGGLTPGVRTMLDVIKVRSVGV